MDLLQTYDTTVLDRKSGLAARWLVIPRGALVDARLTGDAVRQALELQSGPPGPSAPRLSWFVPAYQRLLASENADEFLRSFDRRTEPDNTPPELASFTEYLLFADTVPVQMSPLFSESLGKLITTASGTGLGAWIGFVIAGPTPLALITVPAGIIIGGSAMGVGRALEQGLYERVLRLVAPHANVRRPQRA